MVKALRNIFYFRWNSGVVRHLLSFIYKENEWYKIPFGSLKGIKIHYDREVNYHAVLGLWELEHFHFLEKHVFSGNNPPKVIADVGANIGLYSIWFDRQMQGKGTVHAFEPAPYALKKLNEHIVQNHISHVIPVAKACTEKKSTINFFIGFHHHSSSLLESWAGGGQVKPEKIEVPGIPLDDYFTEGGFPFPDLIKMDIEGGGVFALKGCSRIAKEKRPYLFIESHNEEEDKAIGAFCLEHNYQAYHLAEERWVKNLQNPHPDPEGVWGNLFLTPTEKKSSFHF